MLHDECFYLPRLAAAHNNIAHVVNRCNNQRLRIRDIIWPRVHGATVAYLSIYKDDNFCGVLVIDSVQIAL